MPPDIIFRSGLRERATRPNCTGTLRQCPYSGLVVSDTRRRMLVTHPDLTVSVLVSPSACITFDKGPGTDDFLPV